MISLQKEYTLRHGLKDFPCVDYTRKTSVILQNGVKPCSIIEIQWKERKREPGQFHLKYKYPIHNGYSYGNYFCYDESNLKKIDWNNYQDYIIDWCKSDLSRNVIFGEKEIALALCKMFVFCFDDWFVENMNRKLGDLLWNSLNEETEIESRHQYYQNLIKYVGVNHPTVFRAFKFELFPHIQPYGHWLEALIQS